ncbi:MAG: membrane protein insertion efficiency factor YidD [Patescibacteria group bacterium]
MLGRILIIIIKVYQKTLSPDHGMLAWRYPDGVCRYQPTCSEYASDAIKTFGSAKGLLWASRRLLRCHPWSRGGYDPVSIKK